MYREQCFIRVLAACETMGNATNICSDKTGTLTQNRMTVVEGWLADTFYEQSWFVTAQSKLNQKGIQIIAENAAINRTAYYVSKRPSPSIRGIEMINIINSTRYTQHEALVVGSKTETSLMTMLATWSLDADVLRQRHFDYEKDKVFPFDSNKKRSTAIIHRDDGTVRVYVKGASEYILHSCTKYLNSEGEENKMNDSKRLELEQVIHSMAKQALRTLVLAHKDIEASQLPPDWEKNPPDTSDLCCDCVLGIIDPIRPDVVEAVSTAQKAGIVVRMVTGDSLATAAAIARQCGILDDDGICMEGPTFRNLTPSRLDEILPRLRVLARSSPDDKRLLVMRLNGHNLPEGKEQWEAMHKHRVPEVTWEQDRELLLPGYVEEWSQCRRHGGDVVGVTGDGTNDAPALKVADVGLSMGVTGTKVAQEASDIVILDDRFSSIVNAIRWGRGVYDNIRKFLQFQLTVNIVALTLVFISAVSGYGAPLNAVMMLWVNLIMDTFGALALSTETPSKKLLERKPYRRSAGLISRPMWRNILVMGTFQLIVVLVLLFAGPRLFGVMRNESCMDYQIRDGTERWSVVTNTKVSAEYQDGTVGCNDFKLYCPSGNEDCYYQKHLYSSNITVETFQFSELNGFSQDCLVCKKRDYRHGTLIFNAFIFCQVFNEYVARKFDEVNMFSGMSLSTSPLFLMISVISVGAQVFLVQLGGEFLKTTPLTLVQWLITVALGALTLPVGVLMRFIPVHEDPKSFFDLALMNSADDDDDEEEEVITFTPRLKQTPFDDTPQRGGLLSKLAKYAAGKDNRTLPV
jgi:magnesium-transporting ATPase (P-type)